MELKFSPAPCFNMLNCSSVIHFSLTVVTTGVDLISELALPLYKSMNPLIVLAR